MAQELVRSLLEQMTDLLMTAKTAPITGKKQIDGEVMQDLIDKAMMNLPAEMKQAEQIVADRKSIIEDGNRNAEEIITRAEQRARDLTSNDTITEAAKAKAEEIEKQAKEQAKAVRKATDDYIIKNLTRTEEILTANLQQIMQSIDAVKQAKAVIETKM